MSAIRLALYPLGILKVERGTLARMSDGIIERPKIAVGYDMHNIVLPLHVPSHILVLYSLPCPVEHVR